MKTVIPRPRASGGGFMLIRRGEYGGEEAAVSAVYVNEAKDIPAMTPVLPPPDLRERDGWHLLQGHDEDQWEFTTALWWSAESGEWCNTAGAHKHGRDAVFCLPRNWVYVAPLFPVPDDDAAVERVALAMTESACWRPTMLEPVRLAYRRNARAAIAAIRKRSDNG